MVCISWSDQFNRCGIKSENKEQISSTLREAMREIE
ncbi:unnamed protein product [Prunus brigantina]